MKIVVIAGPTAAGKTSAALRVADILKNVEIVSADAFQVYRGLDIGTAKISKADRETVPHHLIDILDPDECYTAGLFCEQAERLIADIMERGKVPLIVGGTGLYIKTLTDGIFDCPDIDPSVREKLQVRLDSEGLHTLFSELEKLDPEYAARISRNDPVRTVRALEVAIGLGIPFSQAHLKYHKPPVYEYEVFIPEEERAILYGGINKRTEIMWKGGWADEVRALLKAGASIDSPAFRAIGYRAIANYVSGNGTEREVLDEIAKETRNYAKRQMTWFRGMQGVRFYKDKDAMVNDITAVYGA